MITVTIKNFQLVKNISFVIDGFTSIQGPSDRGKSAIIRAISHALKNDSGDSFIRHDSDLCEVEFIFHSDDLKFRWVKRRGSGGYYILNDDVENPFDKLNGQVPEFIEDMAGISAVSVKNGAKQDRYYPQVCDNQHDILFLVCDSDPVKTELIADLAEVTKMTKALRALKKDTKSKNSECSTRKKDLAKILVKWDKIKDVDIEESYKIVKESLDNIDCLENRHSSLEILSSKFKEADKNIRCLSDIPDLDSKDFLAVDVRLIESLFLLSEAYKGVSSIRETLSNIPEIELDKAIQEKFGTLKDLDFLNNRLNKIKWLLGIDIPQELKFDLEESVKTLRSWSDLSVKYSVVRDKTSSLKGIKSVKYSEMEKESLGLDKLEGLVDLSTRHKDFNKKKLELLSEINSQESEMLGVSSDLGDFPECPTCERPFEGKVHSHA